MAYLNQFYRRKAKGGPNTNTAIIGYHFMEKSFQNDIKHFSFNILSFTGRRGGGVIWAFIVTA